MSARNFSYMGVLAVISATVNPAVAGDRISSRYPATRSEVIATHGMVATSQPLATMTALDVLKQGGSAVDAAIAANAVLGLVEPTGSGIGGDLFAIVWDAKTRKLCGLNASGRSPQALSLQYFKDHGITDIPDFGPLPVSVPGCVDGWFELHDKFGRLPMSTLLAPAIKYAREGFPLSELIAHYWKIGGDKLNTYPNFATTYLPGGKAPAKGEMFKNPDLAQTYEIIASGGRDVFYKGALAKTIDSFCRREGCFLRYEDLAAHASEWVEPVSTNYRGYDIWELPPNGQGIAALQMLNILEGFELGALQHNSAEYLHLLIEAKKLAYEDRARYYADMQFSDVPVATLISKPYAEKRRALLNRRAASKQLPAGEARLAHGDTVYLTTADKDRNMVSLIQSNYRGFGSGLVPDGLGFCLQDRGALFALTAGHPNVFEPGKRPFHTIIPAFVTKDGKPLMSFGVMGGDMQPQGHVQVLCNIIDFGMNLQEAGDAARFHHGGSSEPTGEHMTDGGEVSLESDIGPETRKQLSALGHTIGHKTGVFGGYQAIWYDATNDVYIGASESRKDGFAAGY